MTSPKPTYVAVLKVEGDSLRQIARRLEDIAYRLEEDDRHAPVEIISGTYIVTVREPEAAPNVEWREPGKGSS